MNPAKSVGREKNAILIVTMRQTVTTDLTVADDNPDVSEFILHLPVLLAELLDVAITQFH